LTKCGMWTDTYGRRQHVQNLLTLGVSVKACEFGERVNLPSPIDLRSSRDRMMINTARWLCC